MAIGKAQRIENGKPDARLALLEAAQNILQADGFTALSTRKAAAAAGVPLSQIHYHFGSKEGLVLALLDHLDSGVFGRQERMYDSGAPLSRRWRQACDFLDQDMGSGYVRLLQECIAQGWSNPGVAEKVTDIMDRWSELLTEVARDAEARFGGFGPFTPAELGQLAGKAFLGAEAILLLGIDESKQPIRSALRKVGDVIEMMEEKQGVGS